ncbi:hypothetical protein FUA48_11365 [Flavobacterium alkalisoli]|uniref:Uncharacterized protein n=1 Tax=Flavobacterium alkalisoli TaxID=2602769 RepID=A0A5B9FS02_9FLAO|nr:hypothetical protein [Flavobacterium alkalisoli]QEE50153.1 hypothetical protein FUA48_11365 [Flavobacterium alkalisoli]
MVSKQKLLKVGKLLLLIWGAISLFGVIVIGGYTYYTLTWGNKTEINTATKSDVRFVLNCCGLGDDRIENVVNSYTSAQSFTGDYLDAYEIQISNVSIDELTKKGENEILSAKFYRMDNLPEVLNEAVTFVDGWHHEIPWFPKEYELRTKDFFVYPRRINCYGLTPNAAELIFINPAEKKVYYLGTKM